MIKARIEYNGNEYEGDVINLIKCYSFEDGETIAFYRGKLEGGENISILTTAQGGLINEND